MGDAAGLRDMKDEPEIDEVEGHDDILAGSGAFGQA